MYGLFDTDSASQFISKVEQSHKRDTVISERDEMTIAAMVSMQLLYHHFVRSHSTPSLSSQKTSKNSV